MLEPYTVHVLESRDKIATTIRFFQGGASGADADAAENVVYSDFRILPDDSIRDIKMKVLFELRKKLHKTPSYDGTYIYAFVSEATTPLKLFGALKSETGEDDIPADAVAKMLEGHPNAKSLLAKMGERLSYNQLVAILEEKQLDIFAKVPIGFQFARGRRDALFEADPFSVADQTEHEDLIYLENSLLLNYGTIKDNTLYLCLADNVLERVDNEKTMEYITRYYYPGLYSSSITTHEKLKSRASTTGALLTDAREQHYKSIQTFYEIAEELWTPYKSRGIIGATIQIKNENSRSASLEMLFKNVHARRETPYIKFNPAARRENLFRFFFERTTRTGKKIPYLSRTKIMRLLKDTGRPQQISLYLESVLSDKVANCYLHFEANGDIQLQFEFAVPVDEKTISQIIKDSVNPLLIRIGQDLRQTGYRMPMPNDDDVFKTAKVVDMEYIATADARRQIAFDKIPCIYSICTTDAEQTRLKRVENFQEMNAAKILIIELYGKVQYGDYTPHDIVDELVARKLSDSEESAKMLVAEVLGKIHEIDGDILEKPGFPIAVKPNNLAGTVEFRVKGLTSIGYIHTVGVYIDAILKMTQLYTDKSRLLKQMNKLCKKARKFEEAVATTAAATVAVPAIVSGPLKFNAKGLDILAQFESDGEDEDYRGSTALEPEDDDEDEDIGNLLSRLHKNARDIKPVVFYDDDDDEEVEKAPLAPKKVDGPISFEDEEENPQEASVLDRLKSMVTSSPKAMTEAKPEAKPEAPLHKVMTEAPAEAPLPKVMTEAPAEAPLTKPTLPSLPNATTKAESPEGGIMFYDDEDEEEEYAGGGGSDDEAEDDDEDGHREDEDDPLDNTELTKNRNPILNKLQQKDPILFAQKAQGQFKSFSESCQPTSRHPIVLTKEEFDKTDPESYKHSIKYGSDPKNPHYFICPRFWCFKTNTAMSEEDVKAGKCGKIIPDGAKKIPKGAYAYELKKKGEQYVDQYPGFMEDTREDGRCLPCCFKTWDTKKQRDARAKCNSHIEPDAPKANKAPLKKKVQQKTAQYIYSLDSYPVPEDRWGFLPIPVQLFLNMDYRTIIDPNNPALIQAGKPALLRYGVEQPPKQSFLGNFASIYARRQGLERTPDVKSFRKILTDAITLDSFVVAHNGSLLSAFYPKTDKKGKAPANKAKYEGTEFAQSLNLKTLSNKRYFYDAIFSYENFIHYLNDPATKIDHQYLWDFVCDDNARIIPGGLNLVILEIRANDMLDRVEVLCPTNLYSKNQFDINKDTVLLLKHDNYYEPIYQYELSANGQTAVSAFFEHGKVQPSLLRMLKNIELANGKYCPALPSMPTVYRRFLNPVPMKRLLEAAAKIGATVDFQISNYNGKIIGVVVSERGLAKNATGIFLPCAPSARVPEIPLKYMDSLSILKDYMTTTAALLRISAAAKIPCRPLWKIKEDGMIVGFLTETNQFVPIKPNEDIIMDGLYSYEGVNAFSADKMVATTHNIDKTRERMVKHIMLESQFYHAFRNRIRALLNHPANISVKRQIKTIEEDVAQIYSQKIVQIEKIVRDLIEEENQIIFVDIADDVLYDMASVNECDSASDRSPSCIIKENGVAQLAIPKRHLISGHDNETIYPGRLADELVRNDRVKAFMYDTKNTLNAKTVDYQIHNDEFVLVQSALTPEYFDELDVAPAERATLTNYELANPSISKFYPNEKIPLEEQYAEGAEGDDAGSAACDITIGPIVGNAKQIWTRIFPSTAREHTYENTAECTFLSIIRVAKEHLGVNWTENDVRANLSAAYMALFGKRPEFIKKVGGIMRKQGKSRMFAKKEMTADDLADIIASDTYYLSDMDMWMLASEYNLPIVMFNPNAFKGFFARQDVVWLKLDGPGIKANRYYFIRSRVGSLSNQIYKYGLILPGIPLNSAKEFADMVAKSELEKSANTYTVEDMLSRIVFVAAK